MTEQEFPRVCWANIEITVIVKEISDGPRVGNIHHIISISPDGSIGMKEFFVNPKTIMFRKEMVKSAIYNNFFKFSQVYPEDAKVVQKYLMDEGIYPNLWMEKGYD